MHIKSIVVDGFKSYAKRTEIAGFDPEFNAITGLNGSGKSNILDAICFLLGITNLSHVRATNLQDLVYKSGQAGVTKATVSIVFENKIKSASPVGYENFDELTITRQIVIGGKNKYLINGMNAPNSRVQDLFRSVQLNVNNPHFLIMQGRITKVLNMKPPEILSLLEEAASTKHYEMKRENTLATIEKKDGKIQEIDKILREEIKPTLAKLKEERNNYIEYQKVSRKIEYLNKLVVAYDYTKIQAIVENADGELARMKEQQSREEQTIVTCDQERADTESKIGRLCGELDGLVGKRDEMQSHWSDMQKEEAILKNAIKRAEDELKSAKANWKRLEKQSTEDGANQSKLVREIADIQEKFDGWNRHVEESTRRVDAAEQRLQEVNSGFFVSESGNATGSLTELVAAAENEEANLAIEINIQRMKMTHLEKVVADLTAQLRGMKKTECAAIQETKHREITARIAALNDKINDNGFSENALEVCENEKAATESAIRQCRDQKIDFLRANRFLEFNYRKPSDQFDERKVIGTVASLIHLEKAELSLALEVASGARLSNVVIEDKATCLSLLNGNCLERRTTLLPLDRINSQPIPARLVKEAKRIVGDNNVWHPVEVLQFDPRFRNAVEFAVGGFLIARDLDMAKTVAFDPRIGCRCATLDGEIYDPEGSLSGGSNSFQTNIIEKTSQLRRYDEQLRQSETKLAEIHSEIVNLNCAKNEAAAWNRELRERQVKLSELAREMRSNDYLEIQQNLAGETAELDAIKSQHNDTQSAYRAACARTSEAKNNLANSESVKERAQKSAATDLKSARDQLEKNEAEFKDVKFRHETLTLELAESENERQALQKHICESKQEVGARSEDVATASEAAKAQNEQMKTFKVELDREKTAVTEMENRIRDARDFVKQLVKTKDTATVTLGDINYRIACHKKDSEDAEKRVGQLLRKYAWIAEERQHFGQVGGIYDFATEDVREAQHKIDKLEETKTKLGRKVDLRGMNMLGQTEERYNDLMAKYAKVLQDKQMLQTVIDELDKRKDEVIRKAHEQVDRDFDSIFSTLLPGSHARLSPPEGKTLSEGLEFKIAFGNVWKDSLNELSGGQRSLVALSLILALLRFKPAPLYILDEVDAALDISHTQNIGTIIKEQFNNSQFIIVSLKDGMFNNANVLFKTKFVDGVSTVTRHVNNNRRPLTERNY